jgi:hypothetical protein
MVIQAEAVASSYVHDIRSIGDRAGGRLCMAS